MMQNRKDDSRERILVAAERLFSEQGFDKATVERIAAAAGVNKAVIYYHFESKDEIVRTIFERTIDEMEHFRHMRGITLQEQLMEGISGSMRFSPGIRIMLMEAIKSGGGSDALIQLGLAVIEKERPDLRNQPMDARKRMLLDSFFVKFVPFIMFCALKNRWCECTGMDPAETEKCFVQAFLRNFGDVEGK